MTASILGPNGSPMVELGGERAWLTRTIGEFVCSLQWLTIEQGAEPEPCMCLFMATRPMDCSAYVIPQRNAFAFADRSGQPTPHCIGVAFKALIQFGTHPARDTVRKLVDIIVEGIPDLVRMPSDQPASLEVARRVIGIEARAKINGQTIHQEIL